MTKRPEKPDDATEEGTMGLFVGGSSPSPPTMMNAELTPPPGGIAASDIEPTLLGPASPPSFGEATTAEPTDMPTSSHPGAATGGHSTGSTDVATPGGMITATPTPGGSGPTSGDLAESIGIQGEIQPGQTIFGRYLVDSKLGEGGMGSVWLVRHKELDTFRGLKLIISGIAFDPQARARFKREARVMARLSHPNAVVVHDARMGSDAAFIEMEYIRGQSLNKVMQVGVPMPLDWTARITEQLCDVLQEAHERKIVHRDLKPSNLMLVEGRAPGRELLKVLDFGIAKILEAGDDGSDFRTNTGAFMGSALWTSPEQASGTAIDGRSDLYSVGIILYEMLTGYRPFGGQITKVIYNHLYTPPPAFAEKNPNHVANAEIERVVMRCLAKDPKDRPQSARELAEEFAHALPRGMGAPSAVGLAPRSTPMEPGTTEIAGQTAPAETEPANPAFRRMPKSADPLEATWAGPTGSIAVASPTRTPPPPSKHTTKLAPGRKPKPKWAIGLLLLTLVVVLGILGAVVISRKEPVVLLPKYPIPAGYKADWGNKDNFQKIPPFHLVRESDGTRFIHIWGTYNPPFKIGDGFDKEYNAGEWKESAPHGPFKMGNGFDKETAKPDDEDQPAHPVNLHTFYLQENEVTNAEMEAYFKANKIEPKDRPARWKAVRDRIENEAGIDPRQHPAVGIPHELAEAYASWVGGKLPTEAQWEFAARSRGLNRKYCWGNEPKPGEGIANINSLGNLGKGMTTQEVKKYLKDKTEEGIYDMMGNVREWCRDVWSEYKVVNPLTDPQGPPPPQTGHPEYVVRGGSFASWADNVFTTRPRRPDPKDNQDRAYDQLKEDGTSDDIGFRVVLEPYAK